MRGCLVAHTALPFSIFTLGLRYRIVTVDPASKVIRIFTRSAWLFTKAKLLPFSSIQWLIYEYRDVNPVSNIATTHQEQDLFIISVIQKNGKQTVLARFYGQGDFSNNWIFPDWIYWEEIGIARLTAGNQEDESRMYASTVATIIGVEIRNDANYLY